MYKIDNGLLLFRFHYSQERRNLLNTICNMEGEMFLTINPDTLNDDSLWTYRDLQLISTQLGLKANLKRSNLVGMIFDICETIIKL